MTWQRVDGGWWKHPKVAAAGLHGRALWSVAGNACAQEDTGGIVTPVQLRICVAVAEVDGKRAVAALVASGLWHDPSTIAACRRCFKGDEYWSGVGQLEPGSYYFHDWREYQLAASHDSVERQHELRRKRLYRNKRLCLSIRQRDQDLCRYCRQHTRWDGDRKSAKAGTYDHVDPFGGNTYDNVVVACRKCNGRKRQRTPEAAGMELLPKPPPYAPAGNADQPTTAADDQLIDQPTAVDINTRSFETGTERIGADRILIGGLIGGLIEAPS